MADSGWATLSAIWTTLQANGALTALCPAASIYSNIPQQPTFPFMLIEIIPSEDWSTKTNTGMKHTVKIQSFSRKPSQKEAFDIRQAIYNALNRNEAGITITGNNLTLIQHRMSECLKEPDGTTWVSTSLYDCWVD